MSRSPFASKATAPDHVRPGTTLMDFLVARFPKIPASVWAARFRRALITNDKGEALTAESLLLPGMAVHYFREVEDEEPIPFQEQVIHEDAHLIVACKPHFLPVIPSGKFVNETLLTRLQKRFDEPDLTPINRIDRETAGLVLFSRKKESRGLYQGLFMDRKVGKVYEALSHHRPDTPGPFDIENRLVKGDPWFRMAQEPGESNAISRIELVEPRGEGGLFRIVPLTGKKHQIRLHMCAIGAPIANDPFYPTLQDEAPENYAAPLKLLAKEIRFTDPVTGEPRHFISPRLLD